MSPTYPTPFKSAREQREYLLFYARTLLREARARRGCLMCHGGGFHALLLNGAGRARREAYALSQPAQPDLFGAAA